MQCRARGRGNWYPLHYGQHCIVLFHIISFFAFSIKCSTDWYMNTSEAELLLFMSYDEDFSGNTCSNSTTLYATFSRFSSFCWPYRASNNYLASPIGPAKDWKPLQKSSNPGGNRTKIAPKNATCVACLTFESNINVSSLLISSDIRGQIRSA